MLESRDLGPLEAEREPRWAISVPRPGSTGTHPSGVILSQSGRVRGPALRDTAVDHADSLEVPQFAHDRPGVDPFSEERDEGGLRRHEFVELTKEARAELIDVHAKGRGLGHRAPRRPHTGSEEVGEQRPEGGAQRVHGGIWRFVLAEVDVACDQRVVIGPGHERGAARDPGMLDEERSHAVDHVGFLDIVGNRDDDETALNRDLMTNRLHHHCVSADAHVSNDTCGLLRGIVYSFVPLRSIVGERRGIFFTRLG